MSIYNPREIATATIVVAASDSRDKSLATPGYACDGTDDQVQIQAAHDAVGTGDHIHLLRGTYNMASEFTITKRLLITGDNAIIKAAAGSINLFHYDTIAWPTDGTRPLGVTRGLMFHGGGQSSVTLVNVDETPWLSFEDITTYQGNIAFLLYNDTYWCESIRFYHCHVAYPGIGFKWTRAGGGSSVSFAQGGMYSVDISDPSVAGLYLDTGLWLERNTFLNVGGWFNAADSRMWYIDGWMRRNLTNFWCEGGDGGANNYAVELGANANVRDIMNLDMLWEGTNAKKPVYNPNNRLWMVSDVGLDLPNFNTWGGTPFNDGGYTNDANLLRNSNFERGSTGYTASNAAITFVTSPKKYGAVAMRIQSSGAWARVGHEELDVDINRYQGKVLTFGVYVYVPSANDQDVQIQLGDNTGGTDSAVLPQDDAWHWVTITRQIAAAATLIRARVYVNNTGNSDNDDYVVTNGWQVVEGVTCPPYMPKPISDYDLNVRTVKVEKAHDADLFDAAGLTDSATIWTQPAGSTLLEAKMVLETQFAASGLTDLDVTLGDSDDNDGIVQFSGNLTSDTVGTICKTRGGYWDADIQKTFSADAFQYPNPGTDWTPDITGATLGANLSAKKCWLPLSFLQIGDQIISYNIIGDVHEEGGDTVTFDCKLVRVNKADPPTTTDVGGGGITQVTADGNFDSAATLTTAEIVATDKQYLLELAGTTSNVSSNEAIKVIGAEVVVKRPGSAAGGIYTDSAKAWVGYATAVGANLDTTSAGQVTFYFTYREG